jgi:inner membrane transporter RhtA
MTRTVDTSISARTVRVVGRMPPTSFFLTSAVFHYLGPSLAVLLFVHIGVLGVAWLRIAAAAVVFAIWRRPWRIFAAADRSQRQVLLAVGGVFVLTDVRFAAEPWGFVFAFANCAGFMAYVVLGHRIANTGTGPNGERSPMSGIEQLGLCMLIAAVVAVPAGAPFALAALIHPLWLAWGVGVGVCSSVIPYVTDQLAMARLPRATFALMLALLPATATVVGLLVLHQVPTARDLAGIGLVIIGVAIHHDRTTDDAHHD